ncbi:hypothetical protein RI367_000764 [Sorochytrium milnesiophthora]
MPHHHSFATAARHAESSGNDAQRQHDDSAMLELLIDNCAQVFVPASHISALYAARFRTKADPNSCLASSVDLLAHLDQLRSPNIVVIAFRARPDDAQGNYSPLTEQFGSYDVVYGLVPDSGERWASFDAVFLTSRRKLNHAFQFPIPKWDVRLSYLLPEGTYDVDMVCKLICEAHQEPFRSGSSLSRWLMARKPSNWVWQSANRTNVVVLALRETPPNYWAIVPEVTWSTAANLRSYKMDPNPIKKQRVILSHVLSDDPHVFLTAKHLRLAYTLTMKHKPDLDVAEMLRETSERVAHGHGYLREIALGNERFYTVAPKLETLRICLANSNGNDTLKSVIKKMTFLLGPGMYVLTHFATMYALAYRQRFPIDLDSAPSVASVVAQLRQLGVPNMSFINGDEVGRIAIKISDRNYLPTLVWPGWLQPDVNLSSASAAAKKRLAARPGLTKDGSAWAKSRHAPLSLPPSSPSVYSHLLADSVNAAAAAASATGADRPAASTGTCDDRPYDPVDIDIVYLMRSPATPPPAVDQALEHSPSRPSSKLNAAEETLHDRGSRQALFSSPVPANPAVALPAEGVEESPPPPCFLGDRKRPASVGDGEESSCRQQRPSQRVRTADFDGSAQAADTSAVSAAHQLEAMRGEQQLAVNMTSARPLLRTTHPQLWQILIAAVNNLSATALQSSALTTPSLLLPHLPLQHSAPTASVSLAAPFPAAASLSSLLLAQLGTLDL